MHLRHPPRPSRIGAAALFILLWVSAPGVSAQQSPPQEAAPAKRYVEALDRAFEAGDLEAVRGLLQAALADLEQAGGGRDAELVLLALRAQRADEIGIQLDLTRRIVDLRTQACAPDAPELLEAKEMLGVALRESGDLRGAREVEAQVLALREQSLGADHVDVVAARQNLALTDAALGSLSRALDSLEDVLAARERTLPAGHEKILIARLNVAQILDRMGDLERSLLVHERLLEECRAGTPPDRDLLATVLLNIGVNMAGLRDFEEARLAFEESLALRREFLPDGHPSILTVERNLAAAYANLDELDAATATLERVLAACQARLPADHPSVLATKHNLAVARFRNGDLEGALELFRNVAAERARSLPLGHAERVRAFQGVGVTCAKLGDAEGVEAVLPEIVDGLFAQYLETLSVSPREARVAFHEGVTTFACAMFLAQYVDRQASLFALVETRRHVATAPLRVAGAKPELLELQERVAHVRQELNDRVYAGPGERPLEAWREELIQLSVARDRLLADLRRGLRDTGGFVERVDPVELARALPEGSMAIGYLRQQHAVWDPATRRIEELGERFYANLLGADGTLDCILIGDAAEVDARVEAWRAAVHEPVDSTGEAGARGTPDSERAAGRALRELVLDPVLARLAPAHGVEAGHSEPRLFIAPDAALHLVPMDALPLAQDGVRVGDRYLVRTEISFARLLRAAAAPAADGELLLLGDADFDAPLTSAMTPLVALAGGGPDDTLLRSGRFGAWERLRGTVGELAAIGAAYRAAFGREPQVLTAGSATKARLFERVAGKRYVHLATHGWFSPQAGVELAPRGEEALFGSVARTLEGFAPMTLCGLCLAGANHGRDEDGRVPGLLTAEELASYDLSACELAVLSACETNVGIRPGGQGILSLQSALHAAGARAALTSLWRVDDALTCELMAVFYENLWKRGMGKADALWAAKKEMRARRHPISAWAGWVLTGDPD